MKTTKRDKLGRFTKGEKIVKTNSIGLYEGFAVIFVIGVLIILPALNA